ncbi:bifunctional hydroxymethylpyrimidine kinase/phosphomethylpyrimidine kinase [Streptococcus moroccensis]|uniref:Hydroxymethylpyrimidine/phosphomethylpyrimidine kinase n=1 Tax=Streptococcus moroccensis TaxID=1451356 RepID=A0ABT9YTQ7_9STRE|nr:bifunctional hydroxymethylpyrimidine kinase/phosphomethylpyrimidine kinase [Streptococcus moroccensis]MDQ0223373.1 hydroxymethylpyrimidine/phosphomethylpyrimidine kinase [Streptococcus moroccensis]
MINSTPQVVTIAGSDSGGGAGAQADLKTFQARQVFGTTIFVALTAQNTLGVQSVHSVPTSFITAQFESLAADLDIRAAKTGMLADSQIVKTVVEAYKTSNFGPLVVDPVMIAKGGHPLLAEEAIETIKQELLPIATVCTPNLPEAESLVGHAIETDEAMVDAAHYLQQLGCPNIIIKGGHGTGDTVRDYVLLEDGTSFWLLAPRIDSRATHGTGDTFSACIAAELAKGVALREAIIIARRFIQGAIADRIHVGHGHGPTNHWASLSNDVMVEEII